MFGLRSSLAATVATDLLVFSFLVAIFMVLSQKKKTNRVNSTTRVIDDDTKIRISSNDLVQGAGRSAR